MKGSEGEESWYAWPESGTVGRRGSSAAREGGGEVLDEEEGGGKDNGGEKCRVEDLR